MPPGGWFMADILRWVRASNHLLFEREYVAISPLFYRVAAGATVGLVA